MLKHVTQVMQGQRLFLIFIWQKIEKKKNLTPITIPYIQLLESCLVRTADV